MAFDLTYFATRHAKIMSSTSAKVGGRRVTVRNSWAWTPPDIARLDQQAAGHAFLVFQQLSYRLRFKSPVINTRTSSRVCEHPTGFFRNARRQDHLDELLLDDGARGCRIQFTVECDDAAVGGGWVCVVGECIGLCDAAAARSSAGIRRV